MPRICSQISETAHIGIRCNLEHQRAERAFRVGMQFHVVAVVHIGGVDCGKVHRRRKITHYCVQQELHSLVLVGRSAGCRYYFHTNGTRAQRAYNLFLCKGGGVFEVLLHEGVVAFDRLFQQVVPPGLYLVFHILGHFLLNPVDEFVAVVVVKCLAADEVDNSLEIFFRTDGQADGNRGCAKLELDILDTAEEICTHAVHLVHVRYLRHAVFVGLAPYSLGLRLHLADCVERGHSTVQHAERTLHLYGKVHVARSVYQIDLKDLACIMPESCGGGGGNGDTPFLLLDHPVHGGSTVVHLTDLMRLARIEQDTLGCGGLSGIDVGHNADVAGEM